MSVQLLMGRINGFNFSGLAERVLGQVLVSELPGFAYAQACPMME